MKTKYDMPKTYYGPPYWAPPANWFERLDRALKRLVVWSDRRAELVVRFFPLHFWVFNATAIVSAILIFVSSFGEACIVLIYGLCWLYWLAIRRDVLPHG